MEVSTSMSTALVDRNVLLAGNIHATNYKKGDKNYKNIGSLVQINLVYDKNYIIGEKFREIFYLKNKEGYVLAKKFRVDYINIAKLEDPCYTSGIDGIEDFCRLLITKEEKEFKRILGEMKMEKEAKTKLEEVMKYSQNDEVVAIYSDYTTEELERNTIIEDRVEEGIQKGIQERFEKEKKKALNQKNIEIARSMVKKNIDFSIISEITGLTIEEIRKLKEND